MKIVSFVLLLLSVTIAGEKDDIWAAVISTWESDLAGEDWISKHCVDGVLAWSVDNPMPMDKSSLLRNRKYTSKNSEMLFYDVQLAGIAVQGNTAVVHYYFTNERKDAERKIKKDSGRLTDILIKENSKWKYLAWSESKPNDSK